MKKVISLLLTAMLLLSMLPATMEYLKRVFRHDGGGRGVHSRALRA